MTLARAHSRRNTWSVKERIATTRARVYAERLAVRSSSLDRRDDPMQRNRVVEAWCRAGALAQIRGHASIGPRHVSNHRVRRQFGLVVARDRQRLKGLLVTAGTAECERHELQVTEGAGDAKVALSAVDFPQQTRAVPRHAPSVVERDRRATGEHTANQYLIRRRDRQLFAAVDNKRRAEPRGQHCRYLFNIAQHGLEACQRVPDRDREHGGTVGVIEQICMVFLLRYHAAPTAAARNQSRRQHFAYEP